MQITDHLAINIASGITVTDGALDPAATWLGVGTAINPQGAATVIGDITAATGAMATRRSLTSWAGPYFLNNGSVYYECPLLGFAPASADEAQTLAVWFLADALTGGNLLSYGIILPPVNLPDQFSRWNIVLRVTVDPSGTWSAEVTFNG